MIWPMAAFHFKGREKREVLDSTGKRQACLMVAILALPKVILVLLEELRYLGQKDEKEKTRRRCGFGLRWTAQVLVHPHPCAGYEF